MSGEGFKLPETPNGWTYDGVVGDGAHEWSTLRGPYGGFISCYPDQSRFYWSADLDLSEDGGGDVTNGGVFTSFNDAVRAIEEQFRIWSTLQMPAVPDAETLEGAVQE